MNQEQGKIIALKAAEFCLKCDPLNQDLVMQAHLRQGFIAGATSEAERLQPEIERLKAAAERNEWRTGDSNSYSIEIDGDEFKLHLTNNRSGNYIDLEGKIGELKITDDRLSSLESICDKMENQLRDARNQLEFEGYPKNWPDLIIDNINKALDSYTSWKQNAK